MLRPLQTMIVVGVGIPFGDAILAWPELCLSTVPSKARGPPLSVDSRQLQLRELTGLTKWGTWLIPALAWFGLRAGYLISYYLVPALGKLQSAPVASSILSSKSSELTADLCPAGRSDRTSRHGECDSIVARCSK